jgi:hypothetical protein
MLKSTVTSPLGTPTHTYTNLTQKLLQQTLSYNPNTGELIWKIRPMSWFNHPLSYRSYHKRWAGKPALTADNGEGYRSGTLLGKKVKAHRIIWIMLYGDLPPEGYEIDHINGVRSDNRLDNLRCVLKEDNGKNQRLHTRNQTGVSGVSWYKPNKKWLVRINQNKKTKSLGYFNSFEEACRVRKQAEVDNNYHKNHGVNA